MRNAFHLIAAGLVTAICAAPAAAQTWAYASFTQAATNANTYGNSWSQTQGGTTLTVTAYSTTGTGSAFAAAAIGNYGSGSGFGVHNTAEPSTVVNNITTYTPPQHSMDNYANTDMLALNFTSTSSAVSMVLTQLTTGWHNTSTSTGLSCNGAAANCIDSDISLLRYDGNLAQPVIAGQTIAQLLTSSWTLVNDYSDMVDDTARNTGLTTNSKGSSWWLISAYNSAWGACKTDAANTDCTKLSNGDDFVKVLSSVTAVPKVPTQEPVPEPGTLAMAGAALFAAYATRRRKLAVAA